MSEQLFLGNTLYSWCISLIIIVITYAVMKLVAFVNKKVLYKLTRKSPIKLDNIIYDSLETPILLGIMLLGLWISIQRLIYTQTASNVVDGAYRILVVLNITWFITRLAVRLIQTYWKASNDDDSDGTQARMIPIIRRMILVVLWSVGVIFALNNVGVDVSALLGTIGIGGIALALAAQDTVKNIFGAFTILIDKPFKIGDTIKVDSFEGTVLDIGLRSTKILNYDKRIVTYPNYKIADALITNISSEPGRKVTLKLGLTYDTELAKMESALRILRNTPSNIASVSADNLSANFTDFGDSALIITFVYFIAKDANIQDSISQVNMYVLQQFNSEKLSFAFPTQTIYIENN